MHEPPPAAAPQPPPLSVLRRREAMAALEELGHSCRPARPRVTNREAALAAGESTITGTRHHEPPILGHLDRPRYLATIRLRVAGRGHPESAVGVVAWEPSTGTVAVIDPRFRGLAYGMAHRETLAAARGFVVQRWAACQWGLTMLCQPWELDP